MIELPSSVVLAGMFLIGMVLLLSHLKKTDCDERVRATVNELNRNSRHDALLREQNYREAYKAGWQHGREDQQQLEGAADK